MNQPNPPLDERGLPVGYQLQEDLETTPRITKKLLDEKANIRLIDCRLPHEWDITHIEGGELIPLQQLPQLYETKLKGREDEEVIVYCRSGGRSLQFAKALKQAGFKNVKSMAGGVLLWNTDIRPGGPKY